MGQLRLGTIPHPAQPGIEVRFFRDWQAACMHLRDHLLTAPECKGWAVVAPQYRQVLDPDDGDARWRYSDQAFETQGASAQDLYDVYCRACGRDARDAARLGWVATQGEGIVALGTSGILLVIENQAVPAHPDGARTPGAGEASRTVRGVVVTAFLPGLGNPQAVRKGADSRYASAGLVRESGMRSGRADSLSHDPRLSKREQLRRLRIRANWSRDERLYYTVFRPAVQFIRRCHHQHRDMFGRFYRRDYALLKDFLPARSRLQYTDWLVLRDQSQQRMP